MFEKRGKQLKLWFVLRLCLLKTSFDKLKPIIRVLPLNILFLEIQKFGSNEKVCRTSMYQKDRVLSILSFFPILLKSFFTSLQSVLEIQVRKLYSMESSQFHSLQEICWHRCSVAILAGCSSEQYQHYHFSGHRLKALPHTVPNKSLVVWCFTAGRAP